MKRITIEFAGRTISGRYRTHAGLISVWGCGDKKTTQIGGCEEALDGLAKIMLQELAQEWIGR